MSAIEYVLGLTSVIIGLALTDVAVSFHRLMRNTTTVRWDPLALLVLATVVSTIVIAWLTMWWARDSLQGIGLLATVLPELVVVFLLAAAVLPDDPAGDFDLRQFYEGSARYIWTLFALYQLSGALHAAYLWLGDDMSTPAFLANFFGRGAEALAAAGLAWRPANRVLHWSLVVPLAGLSVGLVIFSQLA